MPTDLTGRTLGPFLIEARLGAGAMGTVYRAIHQKKQKVVAIKVMSTPDEKPNPILARRFEREIKLLSKFHHPNIVRNFGPDEADGIRYYAMELVEGKSMQDLLEEKKRVSFQKTIAYVIQICEALQEIHAVGVIHRDLKPANVMITHDHKVKLTDFGIAKDLSAANDTQLTQAETTVGTVAYMSPEQLAGKDLTRRSDLYSLGIVIYRMLVGRLPFQGETMFEYMDARMKGKYLLPTQVDPNVPLEFDDLLRDMLEQDPADRPVDAYVVMQRLLEIGKKAKEGTLAKTRPKTAAQNVDTVSTGPVGRLSTVIKSVTGAFGLGTTKGRKVIVVKPPFYERASFLVLCLVVVVGLIVFAFRPLGPEKLFERGIALASNWQSHRHGTGDVQVLRAAAEEVPGPSLRKTDRGDIRQDPKESARGRFNQAKLRGPASDATEAERKYIAAWNIGEKIGDKSKALDMYSALAAFCKDKPEERGWMLLALDQLENPVKFDSDEKRLAAKRAALEKTLADADRLRGENKIKESVDLLDSIVKLYAGDTEVNDLVKRAEEKLQPGR